MEILFHLLVISLVTLFLKLANDRNLVRIREVGLLCQKETGSVRKARGWGFPHC